MEGGAKNCCQEQGKTTRHTGQYTGELPEHRTPEELE
jgi:hypothetical protein